MLYIGFSECRSLLEIHAIYIGIGDVPYQWAYL
jgi:hypothetical protein